MSLITSTYIRYHTLYIVLQEASYDPDYLRAHPILGIIVTGLVIANVSIHSRRVLLAAWIYFQREDLKL